MRLAPWTPFVLRISLPLSVASRRQDHNLAVFLPGVGDLDLTERTRRGGFVAVRREVRRHEHPARASEDLPGPALSGKLDREADARVAARVIHRGEDAPVPVGSVPRAVRARPRRPVCCAHSSSSALRH
jgi:hypothetical protein